MTKNTSMTLAFGLLLLAGCQEAEQLDLRDYDGKRSPYQHVESVTIISEESFDSCTEDQLNKIPKSFRLDALLPELVGPIFGRYVFNQKNDWDFDAPISKAKISYLGKSTNPKTGELQIMINIYQNCTTDGPVTSVVWKTRREPASEFYISTNLDQWSPDEVSDNNHIASLKSSPKERQQFISANRFHRLEIDSCSALKDSGLKIKKRVICNMAGIPNKSDEYVPVDLSEEEQFWENFNSKDRE